MLEDMKRRNILKHNVLKNIEGDLNVFERIEVIFFKRLIIKAYKRGIVDEFNEINKRVL